MVFSGITFLYFFLPVLTAVYYLLPGRGNWRNGALLCASAIFYLWAQPPALLLFFFSALIVYGAGLLISRAQQNRSKNALTACATALLLGILFYYKYAAFFARGINALLAVNLPIVRAVLPIGISFYTFEMIAYLIDIRRGGQAERDLFLFLCGMGAFMKLTAGPITRYSRLRPSLARGREVSLTQFSDGVRRLCMGLAKKAVLSAAFGTMCAQFLQSGERSMLYCWLYAAGVFFQVYFDFSGYSDMAIGLGQMFGLRLPENFDYPMLADSAGNFWRRWHMTLGAWFRDYLYIPLGGSRRGTIRMLFALGAVWLFTGLWHGASLNYICWGVYFYVVISLEKLLIGRLLKRLPMLVRRIYTAVVILVSFVIFGGETLLQSAEILRGMFGFSPAGAEGRYAFWNYAGTFAIGALAATPFCSRLLARLKRRAAPAKVIYALQPFYCAALLLLSTAWLVDGSFSPFLYFRF